MVHRGGRRGSRGSPLPRLLHALCFCFCLVVVPVRGKTAVGMLKSPNCFEFISRFSYANPDQPSSSVLEYELTVPESTSGVQIAVFASGSEGWGKVYDTSTTCRDKFKSAVTAVKLGPQSADAKNLTESKLRKHTGTLAVNQGGANKWVYLALMHFDEAVCRQPGRSQLCDGPLVDVGYKFVFLNKAVSGSRLAGTEHFSSEEANGLFGTIIMFVVTLVLVALGYAVCRSLAEIDKFHYTVQLLAFSVFALFLSFLLLLIHNARYAEDGLGSSFCRVAAELFFQVADMSLLLQVILLAKGWTIVRRKISANGRVKIAVYFTTYFITTVTMLVWYESSFSEATAVFLYASTPGYCLIALRLLGVVWFGYALAVTLSNEFASKKRFYKRFGMWVGFWVLSTPLVIGLGQLVSEWARQEFVRNVQAVLLLIVQTALVCMYNPNTEYNQSFPFHHNAGMSRKKKKKRRGGGGGGGGGDDESGPVVIEAYEPLARSKEIVEAIGKRLNVLAVYGAELGEALEQLDPSALDEDQAIDFDAISQQLAANPANFGPEDIARVRAAQVAQAAAERRREAAERAERRREAGYFAGAAGETDADALAAKKARKKRKKRKKHKRHRKGGKNGAGSNGADGDGEEDEHAGTGAGRGLGGTNTPLGKLLGPANPMGAALAQSLLARQSMAPSRDIKGTAKLMRTPTKGRMNGFGGSGSGSGAGPTGPAGNGLESKYADEAGASSSPGKESKYRGGDDGPASPS